MTLSIVAGSPNRSAMPLASRIKATRLSKSVLKVTSVASVARSRARHDESASSRRPSAASRAAMRPTSARPSAE